MNLRLAKVPFPLLRVPRINAHFAAIRLDVRIAVSPEHIALLEDEGHQVDEEKDELGRLGRAAGAIETMLDQKAWNGIQSVDI